MHVLRLIRRYNSTKVVTNSIPWFVTEYLDHDRGGHASSICLDLADAAIFDHHQALCSKYVGNFLSDLLLLYAT